MGRKRFDTLHLALAEATGVSSGAAQRVPKLLLQDAVGGPSLTALTNTERIDDADVGASRCYCVSGHLADYKVTLWIDQQTSLLRRVQMLSKLDDGTAVDETTNYEPAIDERIAEGELAFNPPGG